MSHAWSGADPTQSGDPGSYSLGATFQANSPITVTGIRVWADSTSAVRLNRRGRLWTTTQSQLAIATMADTLPAGWSEYSFTSSVNLTAGQQATIAFDTGGNYGALVNAFDTSVTSTDGLVTFLAATSAPHGNGSFTASVGAYPDVASSNHAFYGVDLVYTATGGNTPPTIVGMTAIPVGETVTSAINATDQETLVGATYTWDFGDGTVVSQSTNTATHTYTAGGVYAVVGTVTDSGGLTSTPKGVPVTIVAPTTGFDPVDIGDRLVSLAYASGLFSTISGHEPVSPAATGLTGALWLQGIGPSARFSGLSSTAAAVTYMLRIYDPMTTGNLDDVDPAVAHATSTLLGLFSADFTLGGAVFVVDLLGANGSPLAGHAAYLAASGQPTIRIVDITIPLVIDNVWPQSAVS